MFSEPQKIGLSSEQWVYSQLERRGYKPVMMHDFFEKNCDLKIGTIPIEVKFAHETMRKRKRKNGLCTLHPRWQWSIQETAKKFSDVDWILILIAQDNSGTKYPYILPGNIAIANDRFHLQVTRHPLKYDGWLNAFLGRWQVIEFITQRQLFKMRMSIDEWEKSVA